MLNITIFGRSDGSLGLVEWKNRETPTEEEKTPQGAIFSVHTIHTHDFVEAIQKMTRDEVSKALSYLFKNGNKRR